MSSIGMNLAALTYWTAENPFIDRFKNANEFYLRNATYRGVVDPSMLDSNGWPISMPADSYLGFGLTLDPADSGKSHHWVLTYSGTGSFVIGGATNVVTNGNRIEFDAGPSINVEFQMSNGDPIHDIHVVRADQEGLFKGGEIFNPDFLEKSASWSVLRFMDWNQTNGSTITDWDQRGKLTDAHWNNVPYEVEVALGNKLHSDIWLNVPAEATDDYIRQLATYVRDHLDPGLKLHLEYSNETWNTGFSQTSYVQQKADALWGSGLWFGGEVYSGYRAAQMMSIAKGVFGENADARLSGVLSTFTYFTGVEAQLIDGVQRAGLGPVSSLFKEYATTTYFGDQLASTDPADQAKILGWAESGEAGMAAAFNELLHGGTLTSNFSLDNVMNYWQYQGRVAATNGLSMVAYEGGFSGYWFGWPTDKQAEVVDFMKRLLADPRFGDLYTKMVQNFTAAGGTELTAYSDVGQTSIWGPWGMIDSINGDSPRYEALKALSDKVANISSATPTLMTPPTAAPPATDATHTTLAAVTMAAGATALTYDGAEAFTGYGNAAANTITGGTHGNHLYGLGGDDVLIGGGGDDWLDGGTGADRMTGGAGNDIYIVDNAGDVVVEQASEGTDEVRTTLLNYTLGDNVENLTFTSTSFTAFTGTGNALDNVLKAGDGGSHLYGLAGNDTLVGGSGTDWLDGGTGADRMTGGPGDDTYIVDDLGDVVVETQYGGNDEVRTSLNAYTLGANVERLVFTGAGNFVGIGNELDNSITGGAGNDILTGGAGNDTLDGGAGADRMVGGIGDDTYVVDNVDDIVVEQPGEGTDTVRTSLATYTLGVNLENLTAIGAAAFTGYGNELDNVIRGSATGTNKLYGGAGNDTLYGGGGSDYLDGGTGADTMSGGAGNDVYIVRDSRDMVREDANAGLDEVRSYVNSYTLTANVENLTFVGTGSFTGIGNTLDNTITGGAGDDVLVGADGNDTLIGGAGGDRLDGGSGADRMIGGTGDDTYMVDNVNDRVLENAGEGYDTIYSSVSFTLPANVEKLVLTGTANLNATGNSAANALVGNAGNNVLAGGGGADVLTGGAGADTFVFRPGDLLGTVRTSDQITDFSRAEGDKIDFTALHLANGSQVHVSAYGSDWDVGVDLNNDGRIDVHLLVTSRSGMLVPSDFLI